MAQVAWLRKMVEEQVMANHTLGQLYDKEFKKHRTLEDALLKTIEERNALEEVVQEQSKELAGLIKERITLDSLKAEYNQQREELEALKEAHDELVLEHNDCYGSWKYKWPKEESSSSSQSSTSTMPAGAASLSREASSPSGS